MRPRVSLWLPAVAAGAMLLPLCASGATITFQQGVDGYTGVQNTYIVNGSSYANNNYGTSAYMLVASQINAANSWSLDRGLIKFDLSSLQGQVGSVTSATLRLRYTSGGQHFDSQQIDLYQISSANVGWAQTNATWNKKDGTNNWAGQAGLMEAGTDYVTSPPVGETAPVATFNTPATGVAGVYQTITLPSWLIEQWVNNPSDNAGLLLRNDVETWTENGGQAQALEQAQFYSSYPPIANNTDNHTSPLLTINYTPVPEPMTSSLLLLCGGGLLTLRKRKAQA